MTASARRAWPDTPEESGITVMMPCYNAGPDLIDAVQSVLAQDFNDAPYEILVVDDGSADPATREALDRLDDFDGPVRVIRHETNQGPSAARNTAIRAARYKYIVNVDADDLLVAGKGDQGYLHQVFRRMEANPDLDLCFARMSLFGAVEGEFYSAPYSEPLMLMTNLLYCFTAFRRADALAVGGYDENMCGCEDYDFWLRLLNHHHKQGRSASVERIEEPLYLYRQHDHGRNVDTSHGLSYRDMMAIVTKNSPEIYRAYYPGVAPDDLPGHLEKRLKMLIKRHPYQGSPGAEKWYGDYLNRLGLG